MPTPMLNVRYISCAIYTARALELQKKIRNFPACRVDHRVQRRRQGTVQVARQSAAGDVSHRMDLAEHGLQRRQIRAVHREQDVAVVRLSPGNGSSATKRHAFGDDPARERKAVGVKSAALEANQHVAVAHARAPRIASSST